MVRDYLIRCKSWQGSQGCVIWSHLVALWLNLIENIKTCQLVFAEGLKNSNSKSTFYKIVNSSEIPCYLMNLDKNIKK